MAVYQCNKCNTFMEASVMKAVEDHNTVHGNIDSDFHRCKGMVLLSSISKDDVKMIGEAIRSRQFDDVALGRILTNFPIY